MFRTASISRRSRTLRETQREAVRGERGERRSGGMERAGLGWKREVAQRDGSRTEIWFRIARERERATAYMIHDTVPLPGASACARPRAPCPLALRRCARGRAVRAPAVPG